MSPVLLTQDQFSGKWGQIYLIEPYKACQLYSPKNKSFPYSVSAMVKTLMDEIEQGMLPSRLRGQYYA